MPNSDQPIIVEQTFNASIDRVWDAITVLDQMTCWFFKEIPAFTPIVDFRTRFVVQVENRAFPHLWKLTEVIPKEKITYEWKYEGYIGCSIVDFELFKEGKQTKLKLTSTVIEKFPDNIPEFKRESGVEGWNYLIKNSLKEYLD